MSREGESRLGRWSRLKAETREAERVVEAAPEIAPPPPPVALETPAPVEAVPEKRVEEIKPVELPPIESLTNESDFSLFMRGGVPDGLRKAALRKLWLADSHFAQIDITECHSIDHNAVPIFPDGLKNTIYRAGKGMVEAVEEIERAEKAEREAAEKAKAELAQTESAPIQSDDAAPPADSAPPTDKV